MFKTMLHAVIILLVAGLVAGGIYLFVQNGGMSLIGNGVERGEGFSRGLGNGTFPQQGFQPGSANFTPRERPGGDREGGADGFSLAGLGGVLMQTAKIAVITVLVALIIRVVRLIKRRKVAKPAAA